MARKREGEREFERWHYQPLVIGGLQANWGLYRIEDGGYGRKPCDIGGFTWNGRGVILEVKVVDRQPEPGYLDQRLFERHQLDWLTLAYEKGAVALVATYDLAAGEMWLHNATATYRSAGVRPLSVQLTAEKLRDGTPYWGTVQQWEAILEDDHLGPDDERWARGPA